MENLNEKKVEMVNGSRPCKIPKIASTSVWTSENLCNVQCRAANQEAGRAFPCLVSVACLG